MFEPLPQLVRLRREAQNFTQEALAERAGISRGQLVAFEGGQQNVSLVLLIKIARALGMTQLPIADLAIVPASPDLTVLVAAADALFTARHVVTQAAVAESQIDRTTGSIQQMLERALADRADPALARASARLSRLPAIEDDAVLREIAEFPDAPRRVRTKTAPPKTQSRKRAR